MTFPELHPMSLMKTKTMGKSILSHLKYNFRVTERIYVRHLIAYSSLEKLCLTLCMSSFSCICLGMFLLGLSYFESPSVSLNFHTLANIEISLMKSPNSLHRLTSHESHYQNNEMKLYLSWGSLKSQKVPLAVKDGSLHNLLTDTFKTKNGGKGQN